MSELIEGLNDRQQEVVYHDQGPILVGAGAGSGKTQVLIRRVGYLVIERDVDPTRILAVTFSKSGAEEMQERLDSLIGESGARIGTFHSLAYEIIKHENSEYRTWIVDDKNRYRVCIKEAVGYKGIKWNNADVNILERFIEICKAYGARPGSAKALEIARSFAKKKPSLSTIPVKMIMAYDEAEGIRESKRLICFDDMLLEAVELLTNKLICKHWANKYDYILQDEAQDQNWCQFQIGELLAKEHRNYMLVGDPCQTIYSFRGVEVKRFFELRDRWNAKFISMNRNYRSGQSIISSANSLLRNMDPKIALSEMVCERSVDSEVSVVSYATLDEEGNGIANQIKQLLSDGEQPKNIAVLYRTNAQSRAPEESLISAGVPYQVIGSINFYERKEVKHLLSYLRLAALRGSFQDVAGSINSPFRFLGKKFLERVEKASSKGKKIADWPGLVQDVCKQAGLQYRQKQSAEEWIDLVREMTARAIINQTEECTPEDLEEAKPASILSDIVRETKYKEWLKQEEGDETPDNSRVSNVMEMIRAASRFDTVDALLDYVDMTLEASKTSSKNGGGPNKVTLCSIHRSKGLEWANVFIAGVCEKILPHGRCEDIEEERRIFYVGITRAQERLAISAVRKIAVGGDMIEVEPSRFIKEIGGEIKQEG